MFNVRSSITFRSSTFEVRGSLDPSRIAARCSGVPTPSPSCSCRSGEAIGTGFLFFIAAVSGSCLLTGGSGSAVGGAIGAFIFGMANKGIVYAQWNPDWFKFFLGAMLLFAVVANNAFRNYAAKR